MFVSHPPPDSEFCVVKKLTLASRKHSVMPLQCFIKFIEYETEPV